MRFSLFLLLVVVAVVVVVVVYNLFIQRHKRVHCAILQNDISVVVEYLKLMLQYKDNNRAWFIISEMVIQNTMRASKVISLRHLFTTDRS